MVRYSNQAVQQLIHKFKLITHTLEKKITQITLLGIFCYN